MWLNNVLCTLRSLVSEIFIKASFVDSVELTIESLDLYTRYGWVCTETLILRRYRRTVAQCSFLSFWSCCQGFLPFNAINYSSFISFQK